MDFLQQIFLSNTLGSYIEVAIAILVALLIKRVISKYVTKWVFKAGKGKWSRLSKEKLDEKLITPIERFFMIIVIIIAFGRLNFPKEFLFTYHHISSKTMLDSLATAVFIIGFVSVLLRFMDFIAIVIKRRSIGEAAGEHQLLYFFKDFLKVVIVIFTIIFILKFSLGYNVSKLLTGLSIVGAALALAAKESLENLIASFVIFFDKPFETGDVVKIKDVRGTVERIGLRSTRIRTVEKSLVTVPNKQMVDNILDNFSSRNLVRHEIKSNIPARYTGDEIEKIIEEIRNLVIGEPHVEDTTAFLQEITGDNAIVMIVYYTPLTLNIDEDNQLRQQINIGVKNIIDRHAAANTTQS